MKLALIRRQFAATGGAELYLQRLLEALANRGHEVHLFAEAWQPVDAQPTFHRIAVSASRAQRPVRFAEAVAAELARQTFDCVFSLERTIRQDVYRAGDGVHRVWLEQRRRFAPWWRRPFAAWGGFHRNMVALEARTFDPANTGRLIVNSGMVRREILQHFNFPPERIHLVRNGVNVARFQTGDRATTRGRFGVRDDEFLIAFVGSGWQRKGLKFVLDAVRLTPEFKLLVAGKGRRPGSAPANTIFAGPVADVENIYAAADLLVTLPIYEPSANVVAEGLAAGVPVVTSSHNGAGEILTPETGTVVSEFWKPEAVAAAFRHWASRKTRVQVDPELLSLDRNVSETLAVLELAASEKRARAGA